jgi:mono/diheme cytochrome c family protein
MKLIAALAVLVIVVCAGFAVFAWSGRYDVAAGRPHWAVTSRLLETLRERSIAARTKDIVAPDLEAGEMIRAGAGNYDAMCAECHQRPGGERTALAAGLNPAPPDFRDHAAVDPAAAFWVVKHGVKMTGMPAWGGHMEDEYIWGVVAFLRKLPGMTPEEYRRMVEASGGHSHGDAAAPRPEGAEPEGEAHVHEDGKVHRH